MKPLLSGLVLLLTASFGCDARRPCASAELAPLGSEPHYAVITSNHTDATAVALLDERGRLLTGAWLDSGTTRPGLSTTLSGDVVLPTSTVTPGVLTLIDRLGVDRITRIDVPSGEVLGQIPTTPAMKRGETAYRANPHDVSAIGDDRALVSRYEPNLDPDAARLDRGNDLLLVNLGSGELLDRIPMSRFDEKKPTPDGDVRIVARPDRMARAGPRVVAGLARLSTDFRTAGDGAVAIVTPERRDAGKLALRGLANCGIVAPVPEAPHRVLVVCAGATFASRRERRARSGLALLVVDDEGRATVRQRWNAADHPDAPVPTHGLVPLGGGRLVVVARGDGSDGAGDRLLHVDLTDNSTRTVRRAAGTFQLGQGSYDPERRLLLVPDTEAGILRFTLTDDGRFQEKPPVEVSPCRSLAARQIRPL